jgi:hypothetical protein
MAKKKKKGAMGMQVPSSSGERMSTDISTAENGFIVNVSGETGGRNPSYFSKRFVAGSRPEALRIAAHHISGAASKGKGGKKKSKGISLKKLA